MRLGRFLLLVTVSLMAVLASGQQRPADDLPTASITGVVMDAQSALIPGASVQVLGDATEHSVMTDNAGSFAVRNLPSGRTLHLTIRGKDFGDWTSDPIVLSSGQVLELKDVKLVVSAVLTSVSAVTPEQVAIQQVQIAETQRVFGIFPNFYVAYDTRFVRLSTKLKFRLAARATVDPATFIGAAFLAGIDQASDVAPHYKQGAAGYGQRVGAAYLGTLTNVTIGGAIFPTLMHQDPRYFYQGTGTKKSRALHALESPFMAKGDDGNWQPNYSSLAGDLSSSALTNLYYPPIDRGPGLVFKGFLVVTGARMATSMIQEFILRKITTNSH